MRQMYVYGAVICVLVLVMGFAVYMQNPVHGPYLWISEYSSNRTSDIRIRYSTTHSTQLDTTLPEIYIITPTYTRFVQKAELTRLKNTFSVVNNLHWIVVEDANAATSLVTNFLVGSELNYTHLFVHEANNPGKGSAQRNAGLQWIRDNVDLTRQDGVVFFADDDNTYDVRLFEEMRYTKQVSVWPVAFVGGGVYERPRVNNGKVVGWITLWPAGRTFQTDMAGFAINARLLFDHPDARFKPISAFQETAFLQSFSVQLSDLEPKADNCTKVYVWHTKTNAPRFNSKNAVEMAEKNIEV